MGAWRGVAFPNGETDLVREPKLEVSDDLRLVEPANRGPCLAGIPQWLCTLQRSLPLPLANGNPLISTRIQTVCRHSPRTQWSVVGAGLGWLKLTPFLMDPCDFRFYADLLSQSRPTDCEQITMIDRLGNKGNVRLVRNTSCLFE
jgi:hypothetical protein